MSACLRVFVFSYIEFPYLGIFLSSGLLLLWSRSGVNFGSSKNRGRRSTAEVAAASPREDVEGYRWYFQHACERYSNTDLWRCGAGERRVFPSSLRSERDRRLQSLLPKLVLGCITADCSIFRDLQPTLGEFSKVCKISLKDCAILLKISDFY